MSKLIKGYTLIQRDTIKEIDSDVYIYAHNKTKAKILFIDNEDVHKSFCIGFRTPPHDNTGAPHIIEHAVLCGSRKYPLKDPFVELAKGSLNTYLNAMTYPDKTLYPISSQNDKDFHNLMDVYLDAVFFPKIYEYPEILQQEGWRYHIENEQDPMEYKGVVYNEMKGAFSAQEEIGFRMIKSSLFPETTYHYESGGDPRFIPDLSYEDFLNFHKTYYHPSNSYLCFYGNVNIEETLEYIDHEYLSRFEYQVINSEIASQKPFEHSIEKKGYYSPSEENANGLFLSYNVVIGEASNRRLILAISILEYLLLDTPAAPLKKALIAEGIGEDVYGMFQTHLKQPIFSIVAKNVKEDKRERFYTLIKETLQKIIDEGVLPKLLKGALQVKEFELREGDSSGHSRGLFYALAAVKSWIYDASPCIYLKYEEDLEYLKTNKDTGYFEGLIKQYFIENTHSSKVELYPRYGLENQLEEQVSVKLDALKESLSKEQLTEKISETKKFQVFQETVDPEEVRMSIPLLTKDDLRRKITYPRYHTTLKHGTTYIVTPIFTNKIAYINWYVDIGDLKQEHMPYLGLMVGMLGKLDTKHYDYEKLSGYIDENLGGLEYHIQAFHDHRSEKQYIPMLQFRSKALIDKVPQQTGVLKEVLQNTLFNNPKRILEIIREMKSMMETAISSEGHRIAYGRLLASLSSAEHFEEKTKGISFYHFVCEIERNWMNQQQAILDKLQSVYNELANKARITVGLTIDEDQVQEVMGLIQQEIDTLPNQPLQKQKISFDMLPKKEVLIYPTQVNYVAMGYNFKSLGYTYHGSMMLLKSLLSMDYLWQKVRVQHGAYGCFGDFRKSGNMFLVSYRDPNLQKTLEVYKEIPLYLRNLNLTERELLQYLIGTISNLDFPFTPLTEGRTAQLYHLMGITEEELQKSRDELFETTSQTIKDLAELMEACIEQDIYCVFTNNQNADKAKALFDQITIV